MSIEDTFLSGSDGLISGIPNIVLLIGGILLLAVIVLAVVVITLLHKKNKVKKTKKKRKSRPNTKASSVRPISEEGEYAKRQMRLADIVTQLMKEDRMAQSPNRSRYGGSRGGGGFME